MLARLLHWLVGRRQPPKGDATAIPAGAVLLNGGVDYAFEVLGYQGPLEAIYRELRAAGGDGDCRVIVALASEPGNHHNAHAISVSIGARKVAQFPRGDGRKYSGIIADAAKRGPVVCRASVRAPPDEGAGEGGFRVFLDLASPNKAVPPQGGSRPEAAS